MTLKHPVNVRLTRGGSGGGSAVGAGVLAFGVAADATPGVHVDELLVVGGVGAHVGDDAGADGGVVGLGAVELVGEGVEEAVAWTSILGLARVVEERLWRCRCG